MDIDMTAGATGHMAPLWVAFTEAAFALMRDNEDPFSLVIQVTKVADAYYEETFGEGVAAMREP